jgi:hypothetical protein
VTTAVSQGERFARAHAEFAEAIAAGCSIPELRRRKAEERSERLRKVEDCGTRQPFERWDAQWMGRD